jgi:peptidoglycan/xylan/chitin deacetylase (PgdA/CDA1 family)
MDRPTLVSLTFDDGLRCQFDRAVPILDQHGLSATFFLVANSDPIHERSDWRKIDWSEEDNQLLRGMIQRGHEIGAHSVTHRRPELDKDPKGEAERSKRWIEGRLGVEVPSYAYPFYHITPPIKNAVMNAGYKQARSGANRYYYSSQGEIDYLQVDCRQVSSSENVGDWIRPGCWHVLTFHGIGTLNDGFSPIPVNEFERQMAELTNRRHSGDVDVVTFKDGANRLRQAK